MTRNQRVEMRLLETLLPVLEPFARENFKALQQHFRLGPSVGLDDPNDDIGAGLSFGLRALQHLIGLADAGRGADEDLEPADATVLAPGCFQQGFRRGTLFRIAALLGHYDNIVLSLGPA